MNAIPTVYKNVQYRSRLEAKWAAFFTFLGWPFEYEPIDLNGYIPDFIITWPTPLLVEVKPAMGRDELREHLPKIEESGWKHDAMIVGATIFTDAHGVNGAPSLGLLSQREWIPGLWSWHDGELVTCDRCRQNSVYHPEGTWYCYRCAAGGKIYGDFPEWQSAWHHAGNVTQWKGVQCSN